MSEFSQWHILLQKYEHRALFKDDIIELLRCGVVPPPEALQMIADVMADEGLPLCAHRRPKTVRTDDGFVKVEHQAPQMFEYLWAVYGISKQQADQIVSEHYGISISQLRRWRTKWKPADDDVQAEYEDRLRNAWK